MIEDIILFARSERKNVVGNSYHVATWKMFGGNINFDPHVLGDVKRSGYLAEAKGRGDWGSYIAQCDQIENYELAFPETALYFFWGYVGRGLRTPRCRRRKSLLQNLKTSREVYRFLAKQTNQLYIVDASILSAMLKKAKRGNIHPIVVGGRELRPHLGDTYGGESALHVPRCLLKALCEQPQRLKAYGLNPNKYTASQSVHEFSFVLSFTFANWGGEMTERFDLKFNLRLLVQEQDMKKIQLAIRRQSSILASEIAEWEHRDESFPGIPF